MTLAAPLQAWPAPLQAVCGARVGANSRGGCVGGVVCLCGGKRRKEAADRRGIVQRSKKKVGCGRVSERSGR